MRYWKTRSHVVVVVVFEVMVMVNAFLETRMLRREKECRDIMLKSGVIRCERDKTMLGPEMGRAEVYSIDPLENSVDEVGLNE